MDHVDRTAPETRIGSFRLTRGSLLAMMCVAAVLLGLTLWTRSEEFAPSYSSAPDFDGYVYGFPFGSIWIPTRSGHPRVDVAPLVADIALFLILFVVVEVLRRHLGSWQYSLRRLLLAVSFVALSCSCFRLASVDDIRLAVIPGVLAMGLALGLVTNRLVAASVGIAFLALASYSFQVYWDGWFPGGKVCLRVHDPSGHAIAGAQLDAYNCRTHLQVPRPPVMEHGTLLTNVKGEVVCHHHDYMFGGVGWYLFGCIPIGWHSPEYEWCVSREGYESVRIPFSTIFDPSNKSSSNVTVVVDGQPREMAVYTLTVTMPRE
ncbi:MAG: hypothetical protein ACYC35_17645 [Pirellulales bacterium]